MRTIDSGVMSRTITTVAGSVPLVVGGRACLGWLQLQRRIRASVVQMVENCFMMDGVVVGISLIVKRKTQNNNFYCLGTAIKE
jgi:hypothetical protein